MNDDDLKKAVKDYWEQEPCGSWAATGRKYSREYFDEIEANRYSVEPFIPDFALFESFRGMKVLEIGVGAGTDHVRFARAGAVLSGIDLTEEGVGMVKKRLALEGLRSDLYRADAENLPFPDDEFDLVYSWGVLHHTPDTERSLREVHRVCKTGGRICIMLYHRHSLAAVKLWLAHGLLRLKPFRTLRDVIYHHMESPGTKAYTRAELQALFHRFRDVTVTPVLTPYDAGHLPGFLKNLLPDTWGWFLVVQAVK